MAGPGQVLSAAKFSRASFAAANPSRQKRYNVSRFISTAEIAAPRLLHSLFRLLGWECKHRNYTRPMRLTGAPSLTVSCLECSARLGYDWQRMGLVYG